MVHQKKALLRNPKKVVFLAVHPDDESLGCGGTILKHKDEHNELHWVILTKLPSAASRRNQAFRKKRTDEIEAVKNIYSFKKIHNLEFDTTTLDQVPRRELIKKISDVFEDIQPDILFIPNRSDIHSDHRIAFECIMSASKTFNHPYIHKIFMYECISETEFAPALLENAFVPNYFVDISKYMDKKIKILNIYKSEIKNHPYPRSNTNFKALAAFRGAQAGVPYAEAFMILRDIWT